MTIYSATPKSLPSILAGTCVGLIACEKAPDAPSQSVPLGPVAALSLMGTLAVSLGIWQLFGKPKLKRQVKRAAGPSGPSRDRAQEELVRTSLQHPRKLADIDLSPVFDLAKQGYDDWSAQVAVRLAIKGDPRAVRFIQSLTANDFRKLFPNPSIIQLEDRATLAKQLMALGKRAFVRSILTDYLVAKTIEIFKQSLAQVYQEILPEERPPHLSVATLIRQEVSSFIQENDLNEEKLLELVISINEGNIKIKGGVSSGESHLFFSHTQRSPQESPTQRASEMSLDAILLILERMLQEAADQEWEVGQVLVDLNASPQLESTGKQIIQKLLTTDLLKKLSNRMCDDNFRQAQAGLRAYRYWILIGETEYLALDNDLRESMKNFPTAGELEAVLIHPNPLFRQAALADFLAFAIHEKNTQDCELWEPDAIVPPSPISSNCKLVIERALSNQPAEDILPTLQSIYSILRRIRLS